MDTGRKKSPRPGEVTGVQVDRRKDRPVRITCHGHEHHYEVAWGDTDDGPVITDLCVTSDSDTPITSRSLKRINAEVLARCAKRYDTDNAAEIGRMIGDFTSEAWADIMREPDPAARAAAALAWMENSGDEFTAQAATMLRQAAARDELDLAAWVDDAWASRGGSFVIHDAVMERVSETLMADAVARGAVEPPKPRGGRPREVTREFLEQVAEWAREAKDLNTEIYGYVQDKASEYRGYRTHSTDTVKKWIRRCKDEGLLGREELRRSAQSQKGA